MSFVRMRRTGPYVECPMQFDEMMFGFRIARDPESNSWCSLLDEGDNVSVYLYTEGKPTEHWELSKDILKAMFGFMDGDVRSNVTVGDYVIVHTVHGFQLYAGSGMPLHLHLKDYAKRVILKILENVPLGRYSNDKEFRLIGSFEQGGYVCPACGYCNNAYTFKNVCQRCGYKEGDTAYRLQSRFLKEE